MDPSYVEFQSAVEGLFVRGLGGVMTPALRARLQAEGLDLGRPLQAAYPAERYRRWVQLAAEELYGHLPPYEAHRRIGRHFIEGFFGTFVGRAVLPMLRVLGPLRTLERMERNFRSGNNHLRTRLTVKGPGEVELWLNHVYGMPGYLQGLLEGGAEATRTPGLEVEWLGEDGPEGCTFRVRWQA